MPRGLTASPYCFVQSLPRYLRSLTEPYRAADKFAIFLRLRGLARGAYLQRFTPARRAILRILFARFCREMLLSGQMLPPAFCCFALPRRLFSFSSRSDCYFTARLRLLRLYVAVLPVNSAPTGCKPFTRRIVRAFLAVSAGLARLHPTRAFAT